MPDTITESTEVKSEPTLSASIESAAETEQPKAEAKAEEPEKEADETKVESDGLTDEERGHAASLFKMLKSPETALDTIRMLAKQAGIIETKAEAKVAAKTITDLLKEELGEEYAFMADKLAPAIEKATRHLVDENTKELKDKFNADSEARIAAEVDAGLKQLTEDFDDADDYLKDIYELMDENPPSAKAKAENYFKDLYHIAKGRKASSNKVDRLREKVERNRNDAASRLASGGKGTTVKGEAAPKELSITESIKKAMEEIQVP